MRRVLLLCLLVLALPTVAFAHPEPGDVDGDGVGDAVDNCFDVRNGDQKDTDADGEGDKCDADADNDGRANTDDNCPVGPTPDPDQTDSNNNGWGDVCDQDRDGDGRQDPADNCPDHPNPDQRDNDLDGTGDVCDPDDDEDGDHDVRDNCPLVYNWEQIDQDGDGRGSVCDADDAETSSTGPGTGTSDGTKPKLALSVASRHRLRTVQAGLVVGVRCSEACAATATLVADRRTARSLRLPASRVAARDAAQVAGAARTYAFLRFPKAVKRRVWRRPVTRLTLHVEAVDRAGNRRVATRRLTLVR